MSNSERAYNYVASEPDARDYKLCFGEAFASRDMVLDPVTKEVIFDPRTISPKASVLSLSWRSLFRFVFDQGRLGSCTGNSSSQMYSFVTGQYSIPFSRLFIYYNTRALERNVSRDSGATMRSTMASLKQSGICLESIWPYIVSKFSTRPSTASYADATHRILRSPSWSYVSVAVNPTTWENTLQAGQLIIFGVMVYSGWESSTVNRTGMIPFPKSGESVLGGHAILCTGYNRTTQLFQFINSWGISWGDGGFGYLPYRYLTSGKVFDAWTILKKK